MADAVRLSTLPNRALEWTQGDDKIPDVMEFAYQDDLAIYLVTYRWRTGAPRDATKLQYDLSLCVLDHTGTVVSDAFRSTIFGHYNDPVLNSGSPPAQTAPEAIMSTAAALVQSGQAWAATNINQPPLLDLLAPPAP
ncbi:hypothetical protein [Sphingomonas nostoxanthinifaciens]|uniref:hypothetical protein n=1 Tax=Sphingomonas nostoxanthinifaciens TaxID=2872652 RepID=UPI001CC1C640|nr:hypothetical protein [Sphingomonas nostoxanthinifaciens]UAK23680.1 hypothetical protein K8P63_15010 [Sphingomonas nostoxanthinifaciens]